MEMKIVVFRFADVRRELGVYVSAQRVEDPGEHQGQLRPELLVATSAWWR